MTLPDVSWETLEIAEPEPTGQVRAEIVGLLPGYLMHNPDAMGADDKTIPSAEEEAERSLYRWPTGELYMPHTHIYGALCHAGPGLKYKNIKQTSRYGSRNLLTAAIRSVVDGHPLLDDDGDPITVWKIETLRALVGSGKNKAGVLRSRALIPSWRAEVLFDVDLSIVGPAVMQIIADAFVAAGKTSGVGDFRPNKSGPYGRFRLVDFKYRAG